MSEVTRTLNAAEQGDAAASEKLLPLVYEELRKLASVRLPNEKPWANSSSNSVGARGVRQVGDCRHWATLGFKRTFLCRRGRGYASDSGG